MDFDFTEDQKMLQQTVRDTAENGIAPTVMEFDEKQEFRCPVIARELLKSL